jgi:hypothetical protein
MVQATSCALSLRHTQQLFSFLILFCYIVIISRDETPLVQHVHHRLMLCWSCYLPLTMVLLLLAEALLLLQRCATAAEQQLKDTATTSAATLERCFDTALSIHKATIMMAAPAQPVADDILLDTAHRATVLLPLLLLLT